MHETVIRSAVNYDLIVNYKPYNFITRRLKNYYLEKIKEEDFLLVDTIIGEYFKNEDFSYFVNEEIIKYKNPLYGIDYFYDLDNILEKIYKSYLNKTQEKTKWI